MRVPDLDEVASIAEAEVALYAPFRHPCWNYLTHYLAHDAPKDMPLFADYVTSNLSDGVAVTMSGQAPGDDIRKTQSEMLAALVWIYPSSKPRSPDDCYDGPLLRQRIVSAQERAKAVIAPPRKYPTKKTSPDDFLGFIRAQNQS